MTVEALLAGLVRTNVIASLAILLVLLLRPFVLRWLGASVAYWLWLVVPLAVAASFLPPRERVVVASVDDVTATYESNAFGDRLIVSHARLRVEEALKGPADPMTLDYEGGTVDGVTLHVSSLPALARGERAVFFVARGARGEFTPHLRGQGIVKLDATDHVPHSSLTLDDVRRMVGQSR